MQAVFFALAATIVYSLDTVLADNKLSKVTPLAITLIMGITMVIFSAAGLWITQMELPFKGAEKIEWPTVNQWGWTALIVILAFAGDVFHFYSLHYKIGAVVLCTSYALQPVIATAFRGEFPSMRLMIAWTLAAAALLLAYKEIAEKLKSTG